MRNEIEDLKQQAREYAKQQLKKQVKEAAKKVGQQIWSAIAPVLPYVIAAILILIVIVGCVDWDDVTASAASGGSSSGLESASSTSWEQFKKFVLVNEGGTRVDEYGNKNPNGAYYIVEDDSWNNPTIGHGLCLKSSGSYLNVEAFSSYGIDSKKLADDYFNGIYGKVPVEICDSIWNDLLYAKYESIASQCQGLNLTEYQLYALTDVKYRRGNIDGFRDAYNSKWTSSDDKYGEDPSSESYSMDSLYSFFNNGFTNTSSGVYTRKKRQWILFKYGYYETLQEYFIKDTYNSHNSNILSVAQEIHDAQRGWSYSIEKLISNNIDLALNSPYKTTCCATFVSSVIYKAGYETREQMNSFNYNSSNALRNHFITRGWQEITSYNELEAGDIVFMDTSDDGIRSITHVQLYAGDGKWFNAGGNWSIQNEAPYSDNCSSKFVSALRPTPLK